MECYNGKKNVLLLLYVNTIKLDTQCHGYQYIISKLRFHTLFQILLESSSLNSIHVTVMYLIKQLYIAISLDMKRNVGFEYV